MAATLSAGFVKRWKDGPVIRIDGLRLEAEQGMVTVLFGQSGCGKTTVLRCLAGLETPDEGRIEFAGQTWLDSTRGINLPPQGRNIGFVPQDYALFPHLTVARNIRYGLGGLTTEESGQRVAEMVRRLGLEGLEHRFPRELSGGQQQRVALARAVARRPQLLLLDEPLSALDAPTRQRVRSELRQILRELRIPTLLVTHDRMEAIALGDRLIVMDNGQAVQHGPIQEVFGRPTTLAAAAILAVETIQPGRVVERANGLVIVAVGNVRLTALEPSLPQEASEVFACIRAEDVIVCPPESASSSPRNRLTAVVRAMTPEGPMVRIDLDCGFPLAALLTKQACEELRVSVGESVLALIKAPHIHLIPHVR